MPTTETVLQRTSLTWRLQPRPHCRGHGSTYWMVVKLLRWCTSNFLEFSRDFQESPPKVSHGMLFTGRSLGRHSKLPATGCCQLSYRQESDWRMHTLQELDTGEDTQSAEPGKRSTWEARKEASSTSSIPAEPTTGTTERDGSQQKELFTETICILA